MNLLKNSILKYNIRKKFQTCSIKISYPFEKFENGTDPKIIKNRQYSFWNVFWVYRQKNRCRRAEIEYFLANRFIKLRIFVSKMIVSKCISTVNTYDSKGSIFAMPLGPTPLGI